MGSVTSLDPSFFSQDFVPHEASSERTEHATSFDIHLGPAVREMEHQPAPRDAHHSTQDQYSARDQAAPTSNDGQEAGRAASYDSDDRSSNESSSDKGPKTVNKSDRSSKAGALPDPPRASGQTDKPSHGTTPAGDGAALRTDARHQTLHLGPPRTAQHQTLQHPTLQQGTPRLQASQDQVTQHRAEPRRTVHQPGTAAPGPENLLALRNRVKHILTGVSTASTQEAARDGTDKNGLKMQGQAKTASLQGHGHVIRVDQENTQPKEPAALKWTLLEHMPSRIRASRGSQPTAAMTKRTPVNPESRTASGPARPAGKPSTGTSAVGKGDPSQANESGSPLESTSWFKRVRAHSASARAAKHTQRNHQGTGPGTQAPLHPALQPQGAAETPINPNLIEGAPEFRAANSGSAEQKPAESELNNQMGNSAGKAFEATPGKSRALSTRPSSRAAQWLRTLSERTAMMDKSNPNWKVLEMKLNDGNGSMTVSVMKEDDHVSVSVAFTDPAVKAFAETQTHQILETLKAQYRQDVLFSFSNEGNAPFESFHSDTSSHSRQAPDTNLSDGAESRHRGQTHFIRPDEQYVWIG